MENTYTLRASDYGHLLDCYMTNADGSVYEIPDGATITFQCYADDGSEMHIDDSDHAEVVDADTGHVRYTVQSDDFGADDDGDYWGRFKVNNITMDNEIEIVVRAIYSSGE